MVKIPSQSPKIFERSLATRQIFRSLGFFEGFLTCDKDLSRILGVWQGILATFVLETHLGSLTEGKSGKDPEPVSKDP